MRRRHQEQEAAEATKARLNPDSEVDGKATNATQYKAEEQVEVVRMKRMVRRKELVLRNYFRWIMVKSDALGVVMDQFAASDNTIVNMLIYMNSIVLEFSHKVNNGLGNRPKVAGSEAAKENAIEVSMGSLALGSAGGGSLPIVEAAAFVMVEYIQSYKAATLL